MFTQGNVGETAPGDFAFFVLSVQTLANTPKTNERFFFLRRLYILVA